VGGDFEHAHASLTQIQTTPFTYLPNAQAANEWLKQLNPQNAYILVKGSRSMKMEQVL
jgi:UDP-N-acetylmuramoyl-tripeptide--D-alanyl-D-alanine ligase